MTNMKEIKVTNSTYRLVVLHKKPNLPYEVLLEKNLNQGTFQNISKSIYKSLLNLKELKGELNISVVLKSPSLSKIIYTKNVIFDCKTHDSKLVQHLYNCLVSISNEKSKKIKTSLFDYSRTDSLMKLTIYINFSREDIYLNFPETDYLIVEKRRTFFKWFLHICDKYLGRF